MPIPTLADYCPVPSRPSTIGQQPSSIALEYHQPLFSVITVVKNNADQLALTIDSTIGQTYRNFEYIVIDGGSTDRTLKVIDDYQEHIDCWISEPDLGIYDAMNKGIALARGLVIATLNAGDRFFPETLELVAQTYAQATTGDVMIAGGLKSMTKDGFFQTKSATVKFGNISVHQPALFVTKSIYQKMGLFQTSYRIAGDYDFVLRTYRQVELIILGCTLTQAAPAGVSGNYLAATLESHKARLTNGCPPLVAYLVTATKLTRICLHLFLDKMQVWQAFERLRHQIALHYLKIPR